MTENLIYIPRYVHTTICSATVLVGQICIIYYINLILMPDIARILNQSRTLVDVKLCDKNKVA
jgi:hypothetical protein